MRKQHWPDPAKVSDWDLNVKAHSRGGEGPSGHDAFARGPGARWRGQVTVVPMRTGDALDFQAFLHALRGRSGTFYLRPPAAKTERKTTFSDGSEYSDGAEFSDRLTVIVGELAANATKDAAQIDVGGLAASELTRTGTYLYVGNRDTGGQLLRLVSLAGSIATVRPRLRRAYAQGEPLIIGRPLAEFRLDQETPAVPLLGNRSREINIQLTEAYEHD